MAKGILALLLTLLVAGCGDSMYEIGGNKSVDVSIEDQVKFDYISGNCASVIAYYNSVDITGKSLNSREATMYIASLLECGGYSVVNAFKAFEGQLDYFKSIAYMAGIHNVTFKQLQGIAKLFDHAATVCKSKMDKNGSSTISVDNNISTLCGFTGLIGTVINLSELVIGVSNQDNITISAQEYKNALVGIDINTNLDIFLNENPLFSQEMTNTMNALVEIPVSVEQLIQKDTAPIIDKFKSYLYDNNTVSKEKLKEFLFSAQLGVL